MGSLDERGHISIVLLVVYPFVFILALVLTLRRALSIRSGWLFLLAFAQFKVVGAALHIAAEEQTIPNLSLYIAAFAVEGAGLAPLLQCTLSFIGTAGSHIVETHSVVTRPRLRLVHLVISTAVALSVTGAVTSTSDNQGTKNTAVTLRKIGGLLFLAAFIILVVFQLLFWEARHELMKHQRTLLKGIAFAVPFLGIRVLYSVLSGFSPASSFSSAGITSGSDSGLSKFNSISGNWQLFLVMDVLMEFVVVAIYISFGLRHSFSKDAGYEGAPSVISVPLYPQSGTGYYPPGAIDEERRQHKPYDSAQGL